MKKITIITPTYNRAKTLPKVFESLINQSFKDFLWIILDDGSTDNTEKVVENFQLLNPFFEIIYKKDKNRHKFLTVLEGVKMVKTPYFMVVDSDDAYPEDALENLISEENLKETFHLLGTKSNPYPYIKNSDFFILPSQSEAYPLVINEALALQKPIISTNVGGIPEMIDDGKDGILVNFDEDEIFEAMKKFLTEPELVKKITEGTLNADEKFDEKKIYQQVTEVFEQHYKKLIK